MIIASIVLVLVIVIVSVSVTITLLIIAILPIAYTIPVIVLGMGVANSLLVQITSCISIAVCIIMYIMCGTILECTISEQTAK